MMFKSVQIIIDCRFFALFAVAGSLLGSVLCFVEVRTIDLWVILNLNWVLLIFVFVLVFERISISNDI